LLNFCFCNEPLWLAHYNFFFKHWTIPKIKMLRCFPLAHLLGYESSILGKTYHSMCGCYWEHVGIYTLRTCGEYHYELCGNTHGTSWGHKIQNNSKIPLGNELLSPKGEKIDPLRCMLSCHFNWLHENLISIKLIVTIFGQGHYPFLKVGIPIYMACSKN